jgi:hypothetical protein
MELIFENVEERDEFFMMHVCPSKCGGTDFTGFDCMRGKCIECWEKSGVKYRVKNQPTPDHPVPIEEQKKNGMFATFEALKSGDAIVKCGGGWYIERKKEEPKKHWMDEKFEDYVREVTRGDIQMFAIPARQCGKTELQKRMINALYGKDGIGFTTPTYSVLQKLDYEYRHNKNWKEALEVFIDKHDRIKKPQIEKVIFNDPATIVFWADGSKTVVKCQPGDTFNKETGLAMAISKRALGDKRRYYEKFKKWIPELKEEVKTELEPAIVNPYEDAMRAMKNLEKAFKEYNTTITELKINYPNSGKE